MQTRNESMEGRRKLAKKECRAREEKGEEEKIRTMRKKTMWGRCKGRKTMGGTANERRQ